MRRVRLKRRSTLQKCPPKTFFQDKFPGIFWCVPSEQRAWRTPTLLPIVIFFPSKNIIGKKGARPNNYK